MFVTALRHNTRSRMCPAYVAGLIGPGDRKSVQAMAARDSEVSYGWLHHFIASGGWDEGPLDSALLAEARRQVGGERVWLTIDGTALPKKDAIVNIARPESANTTSPTHYRHAHQTACWCHQGPLGLRAGASASRGRARPRSLRRPIMEESSPACAYDNDRLGLLADAAP